MSANNRFTFQGLSVWEKAVQFACDVIDEAEKIETDRKHYRILEQLESSASSVSANIAEGKGRFSKKEFIRFLYVARGSLFEAVTFIKIFSKKEWILEDCSSRLEGQAEEISKMLSSLIISIRNSF